MKFRETVNFPDGTVVVRDMEWEDEQIVRDYTAVRDWLAYRLVDFFGKVSNK